jgi:8-oxo-dGTP pyrophosphatase MutT (NUDIX family)
MTQSDRLLTFSDAFVISCGTICIDPVQKSVLLIYYPAKNEYFLPKGRKNRGETLESAAARETYEETGYPCQLLLHNSLPTKAPLMSSSRDDTQEEQSSTGQIKNSERELHTEPFAVQQWVYQDGTRKLIFWFLAVGNSMQLPHENTQDEGESFEAFWFDRDSSLAIATYDDDRALIERAFNVLKI